MTINCLSCGTIAKGNFCQSCGQKTSASRFSIKHMISHDFIHGVFHLDKGFLFTLKELFTRPGHSIREYIQGKRAKHFNYFTLLILIVTFGHILSEYSIVKLADLVNSDTKKFVNNIDEMGKKYPKLFILSTIPFYAISSFLFFKRSKQNFTEHLILNSYKASGELVIGTLFTILTIFYSNIIILKPLYGLLSILTLCYNFWFYYQYFSDFGYQKLSLVFRSMAATFIIIIVIASVTLFFLGADKGI
jgi:Protein of unknown function (DUF3667)